MQFSLKKIAQPGLAMEAVVWLMAEPSDATGRSNQQNICFTSVPEKKDCDKREAKMQSFSFGKVIYFLHCFTQMCSTWKRKFDARFFV